MNDNNIYDAISINDIVNSLALAKAQEAGFIPQDIDFETLGELGSSMTDASFTTLEYLSGSIDEKTANARIKNSVKKLFKLGSKKALEGAIESAALFAKVHFPTFSKIIDVGKNIIKEPILKAAGKITDTIAEPVAQFATKAISTVTSGAKSFVSAAGSAISSGVNAVASFFGFK